MVANEALLVPFRGQFDFNCFARVSVGSACNDHKSVLGSRTKQSVSILEYQALFGLRKSEGREGEEFFSQLKLSESEQLTVEKNCHMLN